MEKGERWLIVTGLAVGAALGQAGGFAGPGAAQNVLYAVSSVGLVWAVVLLAIRYGRDGANFVAGGFALLAAAEMIIWAGGPASAPGGAASFAAGALFYVPALLLISLPPVLPIAVRALGALAAVPFGAHAIAFLTGRGPSPSGGLAIAGYILFTASVVGWIVVVVRRRSVPAKDSGADARR